MVVAECAADGCFEANKVWFSHFLKRLFQGEIQNLSYRVENALKFSIRGDKAKCTSYIVDLIKQKLEENQFTVHEVRGARKAEGTFKFTCPGVGLHRRHSVGDDIKLVAYVKHDSVFLWIKCEHSNC